VIKNRLAAKKSREQARHYVQQLEHNLSLLGTESALLAARLAQCERENAQLRAQASMARHAETSQVAACKPGVGSKRTFETMEEEGLSREPAVLHQSSLQLDAFLLLVSVAARLLSPSAVRRPGALLRLSLRLAALKSGVITSTPWQALMEEGAGGVLSPYRRLIRARYGTSNKFWRLRRSGANLQLPSTRIDAGRMLETTFHQTSRTVLQLTTWSFVCHRPSSSPPPPVLETNGTRCGLESAAEAP
jgi:hypothetical protein